ncbi:MAG: CoA pyrophosphatase, partial [Betaproteobacteria bacterium]|nr:CoA pyrophosphatase [Betaproteobacteria bacterium]
MPLPLFRLSPPAQREWLAQALARPAPASAKNLSDGFRLPGREGTPTAAAVLVPLVNRPQGLQVLLTQRSADLPDHPGQISF